MAKEKKAFVFDTNFIVQNAQLDEVVEKLKEHYNVYVTQVSVDERINQVCKLEQREFELIEEKRTRWDSYATITLKRDYATYSTVIAKQMQKNYSELFKDRMIPYNKDSKTFETILDRAYKKVPPFKESESDNGFKDSLMWLSIMNFFKGNGENEILFLTGDKGFLKQKDKLIIEFNSYTGKTIQIEDNDYYKTIGKPQKEEKVEKTNFNHKEIREKISKVLYDICWTTDFDPDWGEYNVKTFVVRKKVDAEYVKIVFSNLKEFVDKHIFSEKVKAYDFLEIDNRIEECKYSIMMNYVEELEKLYEMIINDYADYEEQFYTAVAEIINDNYEYRKNYINNEDLPF